MSHFPTSLCFASQPQMHMENILGIFFLIYAWVLPQKKWNQNPLAWGQATIFLESSLSDSNVQARVRTTALILGGPSVLLALVASAAADGVLDMPTLSLAPGPESEPVCSQDSQTAHVCIQVWEVLLWNNWWFSGCTYEVNGKAFKCTAPTTEIPIYLVLERPWALVGFKSSPGDSHRAWVRTTILYKWQIEVPHCTISASSPPSHVDLKDFICQKVTTTGLK